MWQAYARTAGGQTFGNPFGITLCPAFISNLRRPLTQRKRRPPSGDRRDGHQHRLRALRQRGYRRSVAMTATSALLGDVRRAIAVGSVRDRVGLLRHVTDLFLANVAAVDGDEIAQFDDVLGELVRDIDTT